MTRPAVLQSVLKSRAGSGTPVTLRTAVNTAGTEHSDTMSLAGRGLAARMELLVLQTGLSRSWLEGRRTVKSEWGIPGRD